MTRISWAGVLCYLMIIVVFFGGWCQNIYKLTQCDFEPSYKSEVIRVVGIVAFPVGGVVGWMELEDIKKGE